MPRRIITTRLQSTGRGGVDTYLDRLVKYIPGDIIAAWITAGSLISSSDLTSKELVLWIAFAGGVILTAAWTLRWTTVKDEKAAITQTIVSALSFAVWVFALGGPFEYLGWYSPVIGALVLIAYTLIVAIISPRE